MTVVAQETKQTFWGLALLVILVSLTLIFLFHWLYVHETAALKATKHQELKTIAELKTQQITHWRQHQLDNAKMHSTGIIRHFFLQWLQDRKNETLRTKILERLSQYRDLEEGGNAIIVDTEGQTCFSLDPTLSSEEEHFRENIRREIASPAIRLGDFFSCSLCAKVHLDVSSPIWGQDGTPVGFLIFRIDPGLFLYPFIQAWPTPSRTAETLLVRREGDEVLFLNRLRHSDLAPLQRRQPASDLKLPAARATLGETGLFEGTDYRGVPVLANLSRVPGSPWYMVSKIDIEELYAEVRLRGRIILLLMALAIFLTTLVAGIGFGLRQRNLYMQLFLAERQRREAQEEVKATFYGIGDGVISTDAAGCITRMNPVAEALTGWLEAEALGKPLPQIFHIISETTGQEVENPVTKVIQEGKIVGLANHTLLIRRDGTNCPIADSGAPIFDEHGTILGVVLVFRDQTADRTAQANVQEKEAFNRAVLNGIAAHIAVLNKSGVIIAVNDSWTRFARENGDLSGGQGTGPGVNYLEVIRTATGPSLEGADTALAGIKDILEGKDQVFSLEYPCHSPGQKRWFHLLATPLPHHPGGAILAHLNISQRKLAEEALLASEHRFQSTLDNMMEGCQILSREWRYLYLNERAAQFGRKPRSELLGKVMQDCYPGIEQTGLFAILDECMQQRVPRHTEFEFPFPDGETTWFEFNIQPVPDGLFVLTLDISARKIAEIAHQKLEEQLRQSQKMESVGRLAGGVAHDFNNMLGIILGHTELALAKVPPADPAAVDLQEIFQAAQRSSQLTRQLLAFARKQIITPRLINLNDTIEGMLTMLRRLIGENIDLIWKPGPNLWSLLIDPGQIDQILANLSANARDAIAGVGTLVVETANSQLDDSFCGKHAGFVPGEYVQMIITDSGAGMDRETLANLFEPFFTTKSVGKGTGLGLATVYGIVKQNAGFINVYSEPGHGTAFKIYFPRREGKEALHTPTDHSGPVQGCETILLVEDEAGLLKLAKTILEKNGYEVLAAHTPQEAIAMAQRYNGPIHLLVTDVVMPEMNGRLLQEKITVFRPGMRVLFMSGYTANVIAHHGIIDEGVQFLQKPFSVKALSTKVRELLDQ